MLKLLIILISFLVFPPYNQTTKSNRKWLHLVIIWRFIPLNHRQPVLPITWKPKVVIQITTSVAMDLNQILNKKSFVGKSGRLLRYSISAQFLPYRMVSNTVTLTSHLSPEETVKPAFFRTKLPSWIKKVWETQFPAQRIGNIIFITQIICQWLCWLAATKKRAKILM